MNVSLQEPMETEDSQHGRFLTFSLGDEEFGIEIRFVKEIIGMQPVTQLPETPDYVKGIINLRGKIIPLIDLKVKFKKESNGYTDRTCIIVVEIYDLSAGLIVDSVSEVAAIGVEDVAPPPDHRTGIQNKYIRGIAKAGDAVKLLLDCEMLIIENEAEIQL